MANRKKGKRSAPSTDSPAPAAVLDDAQPEEQREFEEPPDDTAEPPENVPWEMWAANDRVGFFDLMRIIPDSAWESDLMIYLYRLAPAVANKEGDKKYICRYTEPIEEEGIKHQHGGGKYHAILKRGTETLKNVRFSIEGEPKLLEGQTLRGGSAVAASGQPAPASGEFAGVVRELIQVVRGDPKAADAGIRVMEKAMTEGLALNNKIIEANMKSPTGNAIGDQIITALLPRLLEPAKPDPMFGELVKASIDLLKRNRTEQPGGAPTAQNPMEAVNQQLAFVREITGVEHIRELFQHEGGGGKQPPFWVQIALNIAEKLPNLFAQYSEMQERAFQRALVAHQMRAGLPVSGQLPAPGPTIPAAQPPVTIEQQAQQALAGIIQGICRAWDEGYPGDVAGAHLKLLYPELVEQFKPVLSDPVQLANFIASIPDLAERSREEDWAEFQGDLLAELNVQPTPPPPTVVETPAINASAEAVAPPPRPAATSARKKGKPNGQVA